ncbi:MAG: right-handed parallel beta-helix repeat-containing protein [Proteobacteria bacterium]|nr:right-handed parallel beta-helix repeat-containing protein [Pseudomonadota bacterium]
MKTFDLFPHSTLTRRQIVYASLAAMVVAVRAQPASGPEPGSVNLGEAQGADALGGRDSSDALAQALGTGKPVYVPAGTFVIGQVRLPDKATIYGPGTLRHRKGAPFMLLCDSESPDPRRNLQGLTLKGITLRGTSDEDGFSEGVHLLIANGVTGLTLDGVRFVGFRGDGLYLGSGVRPGEERHNRSVTIRNCTFDGINRSNRNGISVIDCDGLTIEGSRFTNCTSAKMPGPIDLEPNDHPWHVIRSVVIRGNTFTGNGGSGGQITSYQTPGVLQAPSDIEISNNSFSGYVGTGADITVHVKPRAGSELQPMRWRITNNRGKNGNQPFAIYSGRDISITGNTWEGYRMSARVSEPGKGFHASTVVVQNNRFTRCGGAVEEASCVSVYESDHVQIDSNEFADCGNGSERSAAVFLGWGRSSFLQVTRNRVSAPTRQTRLTIYKDESHRYDDANTRFAGQMVRDGVTTGNIAETRLPGH